jgi:hypothetical protein
VPVLFGINNMKKIISIAIIAFICNALTAQIADTTAYLRDSIVGKKSYYICKPLRVLLLDLKIKSTFSYTHVQYEPRMANDTINLTRIDFDFYDPLKMLITPNIAPGLLSRFTPVKTPCIYFKRGNVLDWIDIWTDQKKMYFMQPAMVVTDIKLY